MFGTEPSQASKSDKDFYEILNVPYGASKSLIRESYIRLKSAFSSANNAFYSLISDQEAQQMAAEIEEAFRVLNDDLRRAAYNKEIGIETGDETGLSLTAFEGGLEGTPTFHSDATSGLTMQPLVRPGASSASVNDETRQRMQEILADETIDKGDGDVYRKLREAAGVSDDEMQERTKICISYIRAIENNRFADLPQTIFVKGFLRSYLKYLRVPDADALVQAFATRHESWIRENNKY